MRLQVVVAAVDRCVDGDVGHHAVATARRRRLAADSLSTLTARLRTLATALLTGPAGRFTAFVIDVNVALARYWGRRIMGKEPRW